MPDASSTVGMRLKWTTAGDGTRAIDQAAAAVARLTKAEQDLGRATAQGTRAMGEQGRVAAAGPRAPTRADVAAELVRRGADYSGQPAFAADPVKARLRGVSLYEQKAAEQAARREQAAHSSGTWPGGS